MAADEIAIDPLSLDEFHRTLQPRLDAAVAAMRVLTSGAGDDPPLLGGFRDAIETTQRHRTLHDEYVARLTRLVDALTVARSATGTIADAFRTADEQNTAGFLDIRNGLLPGGRTHHGGRDDAR